MSALRERFIEDMRIRNLAARTIESYVAGVAKLARFYRRSPDAISAEEVRAFQVELLSRKVSWSQFNQIVSALRFFYAVTLARPGMVDMLPYGKKPKRLPTVLSVEEVNELLAAARPGQQRMLLTTAYACGLRVSELAHLQVTDIDSARMVVQVRQGKGQKDRQVVFSIFFDAVVGGPDGFGRGVEIEYPVYGERRERLRGEFRREPTTRDVYCPLDSTERFSRDRQRFLFVNKGYAGQQYSGWRLWAPSQEGFADPVVRLGNIFPELIGLSPGKGHAFRIPMGSTAGDIDTLYRDQEDIPF